MMRHSQADPNTPRFQYSPLDADGSRMEIRLLKFQNADTTDGKECLSFQIQHVALANHPDYEALSYVWGDPEAVFDICIDGDLHGVTKSLFLALQELSRGGHRILWVDAICINQADTLEKKSQLKLMHLIYTKAARTLVWLGPHADNSDLAIDTLSSASSLEETVKAYEEPFEAALYSLQTLKGKPKVEQDEIVRSLVSFYQRPYWRRTWIIQEVCLATDVVVICGSKTISWRVLANATYRLPGQGRDYQISDMEFNGTYSAIHHSEEKVPVEGSNEIDWIAFNLQHRLETEPRFTESGAPSLITALVACNYAQATDPHDKLYGLLGLAEDAEIIIPNPTYEVSVARLYADFTIATIRRTEQLSIICLGLKTPGSLQGLPSWALDASRSFGLSMTLRDWTMDTYQACGSRSFEAGSLSEDRIAQGILDVQGMILDEVDGLGGAIDGAECENIAVSQTSHKSNAYGKPEDVIVAILKTLFLSWGTLGRAPEWFISAAPPVIFKAAERGEMDPYFDPELSLWCNATRPLLFDSKSIGQWMEEWAAYLPYRLEDHNRQYPKLPLTPNPKKGLQNFNSSSRSVATELHTVTRHKRMLVTKEGRIGMAALNARKGDVVAIIFGCRVPVLLRKRDERPGYTVVGEAYVHGLMGGEGVADMKNSDICHFDLH